MKSDARIDRRRDPRTPLTRPCKVRPLSSLRYNAGLTADVSASGALLELAGPRALREGDEVEVHVAWSEEAIASRAASTRARVRRVSPAGPGRQRVALEYVQTATAARAAA
jgi:c-di-GMP-binding flagellar brake protein YcgR